MRGATVEVKCACGAMFTARVADRKRGWAKSCSKSCAAKKSNAETGKYQKFLRAERREFDEFESGETFFADAHLFSNEEHDCNKD